MWLGLHDFEEGVWKWQESGTTTSYENWLPGEPNDWGSGEDCTMIGWDGKMQWNDYFCDRPLAALCSKRPEPLDVEYFILDEGAHMTWHQAEESA